MSAALSRRTALRGSAVAVLGLAAGVAPALAKGVPSNLRIATTDAPLIALAGRVADLSRRCDVLSDRRATLDDQVLKRCRKHTVPPAPPSDIVSERRDTADEWVLVMRQPLTVDPAREEWRRVRDAAKTADEAAQAAMRVRLGLPEVERRHDRMWRRLGRWSVDLAAMKPQTAAGLSAKASAVSVITSGGDDLLADQAGLVASVLRDATRLGGGAHA